LVKVRPFVSKTGNSRDQYCSCVFSRQRAVDIPSSSLFHYFLIDCQSLRNYNTLIKLG
jgi:hypothetical protein